MTFLFRILALLSGFLAIVFIVMPIMVIGQGSSPVKDAVASGVFVALGVLAVRCTVWLWRKRRFWTEIRSLSEVAAFACFILLWPIVAFLEQRTDGFAKDALHIATLLIVVSVYVFIRRHGRMKKASTIAS